ncbi:MAG: hypothetical protein UT42_C0029G0004 [Candidatus Falkowbacteria bacterium GW2011_GWA2_39_24]|uniref:Uncharacterized protein n=1 Tax=Candidatus Falkowbacteria bacterium GW2011_GWA2_39_24 TaxID=1618634 RepID=A0A0G0QVT1_9BACT|nr:MAG: hypothetical protein UT42_C0029G0004 [Candidatus Falkowbacteria bacterium GW2011_GWA2_39_24]
MGKNIIDAKTAKWAGLQIDMLQKIRKGNIKLGGVADFLGYTGIVNLFNLQIDMLQKANSGDLDADKLEHFLTLSKRKMVQNLFGRPLLEQSVIIPEKFSLDKDVVPHKGSMYQFVSPYMRDKYFAKSTLSGPATIKIAPTTKVMTTKEIADEYQQTDVFAIVATLHNMLVVDPHSLDDYKDRAIIVPVMSILPEY